MENLIKEGFLTIEELERCGQMPTEERMKTGPVAVLECCQNIPCNPCEDACPFGAIYVGNPITNLPTLNASKCVGCGACIAHCSGLAIFVVDKSYGESKGTVSFPYEYLPLPGKGECVKAVDRAGNVVCDAEVIRVVNTKKADHTPVITIAVKKELVNTVRSIQYPDKKDELCTKEEKYQYKPGDADTCLVCRCEEVTVGEIRAAIAEGADTITAIKRRTRAGMGLCQGRTCSKIIAGILAQEKKKTADQVEPDTARPPVKPVSFGAFSE